MYYSTDSITSNCQNEIIDNDNENIEMEMNLNTLRTEFTTEKAKATSPIKCYPITLDIWKGI